MSNGIGGKAKAPLFYDALRARSQSAETAYRPTVDIPVQHWSVERKWQDTSRLSGTSRRDTPLRELQRPNHPIRGGHGVQDC